MSSRRLVRSATLHWAAVPALLLFLFTPNAGAQYRFDVWTTDDGLPQNSVNDILQTRDSYIWLATYGGLVRFDGALGQRDCLLPERTFAGAAVPGDCSHSSGDGQQ